MRRTMTKGKRRSELNRTAQQLQAASSLEVAHYLLLIGMNRGRRPVIRGVRGKREAGYMYLHDIIS